MFKQTQFTIGKFHSHSTRFQASLISRCALGLGVVLAFAAGIGPVAKADTLVCGQPQEGGVINVNVMFPGKPTVSVEVSISNSDNRTSKAVIIAGELGKHGVNSTVTSDGSIIIPGATITVSDQANATWPNLSPTGEADIIRSTTLGDRVRAWFGGFFSAPVGHNVSHQPSAFYANVSYSMLARFPLSFSFSAKAPYQPAFSKDPSRITLALYGQLLSQMPVNLRSNLRIDPTSKRLVFLFPVGSINQSVQCYSTDVACGSSIGIHRATASVSGIVMLPGCSNPQQPITFNFVSQTNPNLKFTQTVTLNTDSEFSLSNIPLDVYKVGIKGGKWLQKIVTVDASRGDLFPSLCVALTPGDMTGDNRVDILDFAAFAESYGSSIGDPAYNPLADLNDDGHVDILDLALLSDTMNSQGDQ